MSGFIQINVHSQTEVVASSNYPAESYVFDFNKNIGLTQDLVLDSFDFNKDKKHVAKLTNVNAIKLDKKTIVIKGFNESADNTLLDTIDLNIKNISTATSSFGTDMTPVTIDIALDDITELNDANNDISEYEVVVGDTINSIAKKFNISTNTILWANDMTSNTALKVGVKLVILPVSGLSYKVKKGDTIGGLAARFKVSERDIVEFNKTEDSKLIIGDKIIIPGAKLNPVSVTGKTTTGSKVGSGAAVGLARPIAGGIKTQGIHGHNAVDIGAPVGTSVFAALDGVVTLVRGGNGWNGGYGNYIVIKHKSGVQTVYGHLNSIIIDQGQTVTRGQLIGKSGNTGDSSGPHLHFEVRGARNPF